MSDTIDLTRDKVIRIPPSLTHEEMEQAYNEGTVIHGFIGDVLVDDAVLDHNVPKIFPFSTKLEGEDDEAVEVGIPFKDYCRTFESTVEGKSLIQYGRTDAYGNYADTLHNDEFRRFAEHFTIEKTLTRSEFRNKIKEDEHN